MGGQLTNTEIACFLSHRKCWEMLIKSNEKYALIMEDDIKISNRANFLLEDDSWIPKNVNLIHLSLLGDENRVWESVCHRKHYKIGNGYDLYRPISPSPMGTQGYIISRSAAEFALSKSKIFSVPVDNYLFGYKGGLVFNIPIWKLNSSIICCANVQSDIGVRSDGRKFNPSRGKFIYTLSKWYRSIFKRFGINIFFRYY